MQRFKAIIAITLHGELGCVPKKEEVEQIFIIARVMHKVVLGLHSQRRQQKNGSFSYINFISADLNLRKRKC